MELLLIVTGISLMVFALVLRCDKRYKICQFLLGLITLFAGIWFETFADQFGQLGYLLALFSLVWAFFIATYSFIKTRIKISVLAVVNALLYILVILFIYMEQEQIQRIPISYSLGVRVGISIIIVIQLILLYSLVKKNEEHHIEIEHQNQNLKLQIFTSQISPHFILNTLGAIRNMIRIDGERAYDLLYDFSKYIRSNIEDKDYSKPIPFLEEIDYIDTYLKLEKLRFGDRIKIEKDFETTEFWVLPLTIQPFVENAVKHGLMEAKRGGTVWIRSRILKNNICIEIEDNGVGFVVEEMQEDTSGGKSVGMKSAMYRIQYDMGGICKVKSSTEPGKSGTIIHIEVPVKRGGAIENHNR